MYRFIVTISLENTFHLHVKSKYKFMYLKNVMLNTYILGFVMKKTFTTKLIKLTFG